MDKLNVAWSKMMNVEVQDSASLRVLLNQTTNQIHRRKPNNLLWDMYHERADMLRELIKMQQLMED